MMHVLLEIVLGTIVFALPLVVGKIFRSRPMGFTYLTGQLLLWSVFQIVAVPAVYCRISFSALFWIYTGLVTAMTVTGIVFIRRSPGQPTLKDREEQKEHRKQWLRDLSPFLVIALFIIAYQCCIYIFGMHLDEDDARWIAEANDALIKDKMLLYNPATGEYVGRFIGEVAKDVYSPWSMYLACLSRWTGIKPVIIAHTVYPPILLGMSYSAYYEIGAQLFIDEQTGRQRMSRRHERGIFLLMVAVINLFMGGNIYTQSVFTLTRIWQGKAVVAALMIPSILMATLRIQAEDTAWNWFLLMISGTACCLFSGMGIVIGGIMIAVYGAYAVIRSIARNWKTGLFRIPLLALSIAPSIVYGIGYMRLL